MRESEEQIGQEMFMAKYMCEKILQETSGILHDIWGDVSLHPREQAFKENIWSYQNART